MDMCTLLLKLIPELQLTHTGFYKVGATGNANPDVTRSSLNTGSPRRLEVMLFNPVSATQEAKTKFLKQ